MEYNIGGDIPYCVGELTEFPRSLAEFEGPRPISKGRKEKKEQGKGKEEVGPKWTDGKEKGEEELEEGIGEGRKRE